MVEADTTNRGSGTGVTWICAIDGNITNYSLDCARPVGMVETLTQHQLVQ